jgi:Pin2-interacting protein X1
MLGVGAAQSKDPNGIAWKQNKDFEALLRRLNEGVEEETAVVSEGEAGMGEEGVLEVTDEGPEKAEKKKRKRKDKDDSNEKKEKKKRKKEKDADDLSVMKLKPGEATPTPIIIEESSSSTTITVPTKSAVPRLRAYVHIFDALINR